MDKELKTTEAQRRASRKYEAKTYKQVKILLRKDEDADLIEIVDEVQAKGIPYRDWLRSLLFGKTE